MIIQVPSMQHLLLRAHIRTLQVQIPLLNCSLARCRPSLLLKVVRARRRRRRIDTRLRVAYQIDRLSRNLRMLINQIAAPLPEPLKMLIIEPNRLPIPSDILQLLTQLTADDGCPVALAHHVHGLPAKSFVFELHLGHLFF